MNAAARNSGDTFVYIHRRCVLQMSVFVFCCVFVCVIHVFLMVWIMATMRPARI